MEKEDKRIFFLLIRGPEFLFKSVFSGSFPPFHEHSTYYIARRQEERRKKINEEKKQQQFSETAALSPLLQLFFFLLLVVATQIVTQLFLFPCCGRLR